MADQKAAMSSRSCSKLLPLGSCGAAGTDSSDEVQSQCTPNCSSSDPYGGTGVDPGFPSSPEPLLVPAGPHTIAKPSSCPWDEATRGGAEKSRVRINQVQMPLSCHCDLPEPIFWVQLQTRSPSLLNCQAPTKKCLFEEEKLPCLLT